MSGERQYVELLFRATKKFASWDPEALIEVGDWGHVTTRRHRWAFWRPKRCVFVKEGNIYTDKDKIGERYGIPEPTIIGNFPNELTWFKSLNAQDMDIDASAESQTSDLARCTLKAGFQFSSDGGAVLVMADDSITTIEPANSLRRLLGVDKLRDRVVVSEVHRCASYARYLASPRTNNIVIGLTAPPVPGVLGNFQWVRNNLTGDFKSKADSSGERKCYPLYKLASLKTVGAGYGSFDDGLPPLPDALPPWMVDK